MVLINKTTSLCPQCLKLIDAQVVERDGKTFLFKTCPEHGYFEALHPIGDAADYRAMAALFKNHFSPAAPDGLVINLTPHCNLNCAFCFARANECQFPEPTLAAIKNAIAGFKGSTVYLSGGEPTLREDLFEIIGEIKKQRYHVALFTNGKKLVDEGFVSRLKEHALDLVILQFDTFDEQECQMIRGERLVASKLEVIGKLKAARIPVYLFSMLVQEINLGQVEKLVNFVVQKNSNIKILNLNPVWEMGRVGKHSPMNMSQILKLVEAKTGISREDFIDGSAFGYYLSSLFGQITGRGANRHPWCEMRAYVFPGQERIVTLGRIVNLKKLNHYLKEINQRLRKTTKFKICKLLVSLPYGFLLQEFLCKRQFRGFIYKILKSYLGSLKSGGRYNLMDLEMASIIVGTFHTSWNIDFNLASTCNLYSDFPGGEHRSSCLRQIMLTQKWATAASQKCRV